ncbi:hypothetical protein DM02DRAFT_427261 [Periconia macrospinosa]|uniref:Uncharacterized protein n=1 Tax=Periconia macrospinosa TaxID=97972 RepID=A0A2V1EAD2_9PLEO|nr:hypothetical protein DM02DRAFT_427261 [Periconia macrospinosa]
MAHNARHTPSPSGQDRICKACNRTMASISSEGDLVPLGTQDEACDICKPFEQLYSVMQTKDEAFSALESRRFEHLPRYQALEESKAAHRAFDNFLIQTEAQSRTRVHAPKPGAPDLSLGSTLASITNEGHGQAPPQPEEIHKPRLDRSRSSASPTKRRRPLLNDGRRVSFDSTVVFYDKEHGRPDEAFSRSSKEYAPGRNAPTKGKEFLDTSGLNTTATRFFGVKRLKKGWVETKEGREMDREWDDEKQIEIKPEAANQSPVQGGVAGEVEKRDDCLPSGSTLESRQEDRYISTDDQERKASLSQEERLVSIQNQMKPRSTLEHNTFGSNGSMTSITPDGSLSVGKDLSGDVWALSTTVSTSPTSK